MYDRCLVNYVPSSYFVTFVYTYTVFFKDLEPFMMLFECNKDEGGKKGAK
jgi:hypothetical protein